MTALTRRGNLSRTLEHQPLATSVGPNMAVCRIKLLIELNESYERCILTLKEPRFGREKPKPEFVAGYT